MAAESALRCRIELRDAAFVIDRHDAVERRVQDRCLARLTALQLFVGCRKFSGSSPDPLIELVGDPLLFPQEPCLLQPDRGLIRRYAQQQSLGLSREVRSPRPGYHDSDFSLQPQGQGHDRDVFVAKTIPHQRSPLPWVRPQPAGEHLADLVRRGRQVSRLRDPDHLDGRLAHQPHIDEIQSEHALENVEQGTNDLGWVAATPEGGKCEDAGQIIDAAPEALDLVGGMFGSPFHVRWASTATKPARLAMCEARARTDPAARRTDSGGGCCR